MGDSKPSDHSVVEMTRELKRYRAKTALNERLRVRQSTSPRDNVLKRVALALAHFCREHRPSHRPWLSDFPDVLAYLDGADPNSPLPPFLAYLSLPTGDSQGHAPSDISWVWSIVRTVVSEMEDVVTPVKVRWSPTDAKALMLLLKPFIDHHPIHNRPETFVASMSPVTFYEMVKYAPALASEIPAINWLAPRWEKCSDFIDHLLANYHFWGAEQHHLRIACLGQVMRSIDCVQTLNRSQGHPLIDFIYSMPEDTPTYQAWTQLWTLAVDAWLLPCGTHMQPWGCRVSRTHRMISFLDETYVKNDRVMIPESALLIDMFDILCPISRVAAVSEQNTENRDDTDMNGTYSSVNQARRRVCYGGLIKKADDMKEFYRIVASSLKTHANFPPELVHVIEQSLLPITALPHLCACRNPLSVLPCARS